MKLTIGLVAAGALALGPALGAQPAPGSIPPHHQTGQQVGDQVPDGLECDEGGAAPSRSGRDPGPGSPFQEDSISGDHYAGEQDRYQQQEYRIRVPI
jgi:hypothetical protein